jgi:hypothetical protein
MFTHGSLLHTDHLPEQGNVARRDVAPVSSGGQRRRVGEEKKEEKSVLGRQSHTHTQERGNEHQRGTVFVRAW